MEAIRGAHESEAERTELAKARLKILLNARESFFRECRLLVTTEVKDVYGELEKIFDGTISKECEIITKIS